MNPFSHISKTAQGEIVIHQDFFLYKLFRIYEILTGRQRNILNLTNVCHFFWSGLYAVLLLLWDKKILRVPALIWIFFLASVAFLLAAYGSNPEKTIEILIISGVALLIVAGIVGLALGVATLLVDYMRIVERVFLLLVPFIVVPVGCVVTGFNWLERKYGWKGVLYFLYGWLSLIAIICTTLFGPAFFTEAVQILVLLGGMLLFLGLFVALVFAAVFAFDYITDKIHDYRMAQRYKRNKNITATEPASQQMTWFGQIKSFVKVLYAFLYGVHKKLCRTIILPAVSEDPEELRLERIALGLE